MKKRTQVVNVDCYYDYSRERRLLEAFDADLVLQRAQNEDEVIAACRDADIALLETVHTPMTARVIEQMQCCRAIIKYAVGYDNVDVSAASDAGIVVANSADYCTEEVSDQTVAMLLAAVRRVPFLDRHVRSGGWFDFERTASMHRVRNLTLGVMGLGRIGRSVVKKMSGFEMRILGFDPYVGEQGAPDGVELVPVEQLYRESDLISIHTPLTPSTRGLVGEAAFRLMKPSAIVVNTSRGGIIDQDALVRALQEKRIGGAALDVLVEEPPPAGSPLLGFDNVILTPHVGARSEEALANLHETVTRSIEAILRGFWPPFPVNPQVRPRAPLRPWSEFQAKFAAKT
jgi:D-3-phosphoglycerate dehydrogenase / 2-oxoglutarate reductase